MNSRKNAAVSPEGALRREKHENIDDMCAAAVLGLEDDTCVESFTATNRQATNIVRSTSNTSHVGSAASCHDRG